MIDKEIRALIENRRKDWRYGNSVEAKYKAEECKDILELIDSLQEEPVSEQNLSNVQRTVKDWKEEPIIEVLDRYLDRVPDEEVLKTKIAINEWFNVYFPKLQEEPVKIKKGCKYRSICNVTNNDTRNISFVAGKIYLAPEDDTLVSEENGWLCDTSEDTSNFELVEEPISEEQLNTAAREWICDHKEGERLFVKDAFIAGVKWILEQQKK